MPWRQPSFKPAWLAHRRESRPSSHGRGYGSAAWQRVRKAVIARDGGVCQSCGKLIYEAGDAHIDHVNPKPVDEAAEATPLEGLALLCRRCHSVKTSREQT